VYPGRFFVFGETKKSAEADSFVVPQLALRLDFRSKKQILSRPDSLIFDEINAVGVRRSLAFFR
jgi:hypothetical protein